MGINLEFYKDSDIHCTFDPRNKSTQDSAMRNKKSEDMNMTPLECWTARYGFLSIADHDNEGELISEVSGLLRVEDETRAALNLCASGMTVLYQKGDCKPTTGMDMDFKSSSEGSTCTQALSGGILKVVRSGETLLWTRGVQNHQKTVWWEYRVSRGELLQ